MDILREQILANLTSKVLLVSVKCGNSSYHFFIIEHIGFVNFVGEIFFYKLVYLLRLCIGLSLENRALLLRWYWFDVWARNCSSFICLDEIDLLFKCYLVAE